MGKGNRRSIRSLNLLLLTIALSVLLCDIASAFARTSLQPLSAKVARASGPSDDGISRPPTTDYAVFVDPFAPPESSVSAQSGYLLTRENVTVRQSDAGSDYLLAVSFAIPDVPDVKFDTIMINGLQIVGKEKSHDKVYPPVHGSWQPKERVEFSIRVPKENADPSLGWNLIFCVGSPALCYPSPNLLALVPGNQPSSVSAPYRNPLSSENVTVRQSDSGSYYLLDVSFAIPDAPEQTFDIITIYGMQIVGEQRLHDMNYPSVHGSWQRKEHVEFSIKVLKENADPSLGWNVTFCVGSAASCYPSPNLLTLVPRNRAASADLKNPRPRGMDAYRQGDYAGALRIFRQMIAADSNDIVAYNVAANCSLRLKDYPSAIDHFKHALQLQPDEYHNVSGLIRAYTLAGMAPQRDELRKHIAELEDAGRLPETFNYVFETFDVGNNKIEVAEFPKIQGFYGERYRFMVFDSAGKEVYCIALESDSLEQPAWAKKHPKEAAAGGRKFSLDGYASDSHSTFAFYDGEPRYEQVREQVKQILAGKNHAISKTVYASPEPIPGAE